MTTTYSIDNDVSENLSYITVPSGIVVDSFRVEAYNHINSRIRKIYTVPVDSADITDIAILKSIESKRSAGRILLAVATVHEVENVSEYGKLLINEAKNEIKDLEDEKVVLSIDAERDTDDSDEVIDPPIITGSAADDYPTFDRPMSGIENDAIEGKVDSEKYNELEDNKRI